MKPLTWSQEIDGLAADEATKDMIYALDKALEQGVIRILAREQFFHRDLLVKLKVKRGFYELNPICKNFFQRTLGL